MYIFTSIFYYKWFRYIYVTINKPQKRYHATKCTQQARGGIPKALAELIMTYVRSYLLDPQYWIKMANFPH